MATMGLVTLVAAQGSGVNPLVGLVGVGGGVITMRLVTPGARGRSIRHFIALDGMGGRTATMGPILRWSGRVDLDAVDGSPVGIINEGGWTAAVASKILAA